MSRLSHNEADALRSWFALTKALYSAGRTGVPTPTRPLGWMVLVCLALHAKESISYAELQAACGVKSRPSLTQVFRPLIKAKHVSSSRRGRARQLTLQEPGRDVVGEIAKRALQMLKS